MIELPRAALTAGEIAEVADFFSFGTNDLTQTAFGLLAATTSASSSAMYEERKLVPANPFVTVDRPGVGRLMRIACEEGRAANPTCTSGSAASTAATRERRVLPRDRPGLRVLLAVPGRDGATGGRSGRGRQRRVGLEVGARAFRGRP